GNTASGYTGTVHFSSSDAQAVLPANYTFTATDAGVHTFSATLKTPGAQSVTATDTTAASLTASQTGIAVSPAAPATLAPAALPGSQTGIAVGPAAPSNLAAVAVSGTQVNLTWADNANTVDGFKLYRSSDGVNWTWFATAGAGATATPWWGASPSTSYSFR